MLKNIFSLLLVSSYVFASWSSQDKKAPDDTLYIPTKNSEILKTYIWYPDNFDTNKNYSAVVMAHGCGGVHYKDEPSKWTAKYIAGKYKVWAKLLNDEDILVVLVDSFTTRDVNGDVGGGVCSSNDALGRPSKIDPISVRPADIAYTIKTLRDSNNFNINKVGVLGFSNGGTSALVLANHQDLINRNNEISSKNKQWFNLPFSDEFKADIIVSMYPGCGLNGYTEKTKNIFLNNFSTYTQTFLFAASNDTSLPANTKEKCLKLRVLDSNSAINYTNMQTTILKDTNHQFDYKENDKEQVQTTLKRIISLFKSM